MATFSWSDTARAVFGSCLPCLPSSRSPDTDDHDDPQQSARRDELESLLQGAEFSDAEMDADALSLHSQIGRQDGRKRVKRKRGRNKRSITLFGFDLFGRPLAAPQAEEQGSDQEQDARLRISRISSSTLDSDAAPLADDAIAQLSTQTQARQEEDEARKARKRMRKQRKAAALLGAQDEFEGFPGSRPAADEFGAFQQAPQPLEAEREFVHVEGGGADEEDTDADFGAGSYVRTAVPRSDSGSGTRSRTSASASNTQDPPPVHRVPLPPPSASSVKPKRSKKSGKRSATTTSSTTSQPRSPTTAAHVPRVDIASPTREGFIQDEQFEGVPQDGDAFPAVRPSKHGLKLTGQSVHGDLEGSLPSPRLSSSRGFPSPGLAGGFPSPGLGRSSGFPSPGLGGRKNSLSMGGNGAFLARTGEDA